MDQIDELIEKINEWEQDPDQGIGEAIDLLYDLKQVLRSQQDMMVRLDARENQIMTLCSLVGVQAEEDLEPRITELVRHGGRQTTHPQ